MKKLLVFYGDQTFFTSDGWRLKRWRVDIDGNVNQIEDDKFNYDYMED